MTAGQPMAADVVARRRVLEALRAGVPSWSAVAALGSGQPEVEDRFLALLDSVTDPRPAARGLLVGGGFGTGKSHVLTHLAALALQAGFVVSPVTISKETALHDPAKVFRAALDAAVAPGRVPGVLAEAVAGLEPGSPAYAELTRWLNAADCPVDDRFAATLLLHERLRDSDALDAEDTRDAILRFWSGDPLRVSDLRRALKAVGAAGLFELRPVAARELARQRFPFLARLLGAAGHGGWVVLLDEVELIGRYTVLQRGRAYAELGHWLRGRPEDPGAPLLAVLAITDDFEAAVLTERGDLDAVPARLRAKQTTDYDEIAAHATAGMRHIERDLVQLSPPDDAELDAAYRRVKQMHGEAFGWSPPDVAGLERLGATRMRQHIRSWINEWDLIWLDPSYQPATEVVDVAVDYTEDAAFDDDSP